MLSQNKQWYAVYTRPRWEKKVDMLLTNKSITSWCPVQKVERFWSDRKKIIEDPIFRSYVFVHINEAERVEVLRTDGILNFVFHEKKPAIIKDEEIELIKRYLADETAKVSVISEQGFKADMQVVVNHGVFMHNTGIVIRGGKKKVFVKLQSLGQVMVVEFPAEYLSIQ